MVYLPELLYFNPIFIWGREKGKSCATNRQNYFESIFIIVKLFVLNCILKKIEYLCHDGLHLKRRSEVYVWHISVYNS